MFSCNQPFTGKLLFILPQLSTESIYIHTNVLPFISTERVTSQVEDSHIL